MSLTDKQLTYAFNDLVPRLTDCNGQRCGRSLTENGIEATRRTCEGIAIIVDGKVKIHDSCGEPCSWICYDVRQFSQQVEQLQEYDRIITAIKDRCP